MNGQDRVLAIEHVRNRPAMFVGGVDQIGVFQTLADVYYCCANDVVTGFFTDMEIVLHTDHSISLKMWSASSGAHQIQPKSRTRSIQSMVEYSPIPPTHTDYQMGIFNNDIFVVNCLSRWLTITLKQENIVHCFRWEQGINFSSGSPIDFLNANELVVHWMPDPDIFGQSHLHGADTEKFLKKMAPMLREAKHIYHNQLRQKSPLSLSTENGIATLVEYINEPYITIGSPIRRLTVWKDSHDDLAEMDFAVQFHREPGVTVISAANLRYTNGGGPHADGLAAGVQGAIQEVEYYDRERQRTNFGPGYTAAISVRLRHPRFEGSTMSRLGNEEIREDVERFVRKSMLDHFANDENLRRTIQFT